MRPPVEPAIRVRRLTTLDELHASRDRLDALADRAGDLGLFYGTAWVERAYPYYVARGKGPLAFLLVERGTEPIALAPFQITRKDLAHAGQRVLHFFGGTWDELDNWVPAFLFADRDPQVQEECLQAIVEALWALAPEWDLLELRLLREDFSGREVLRRAFPALNEAPSSLITPRIRLPHAVEGARLTRMLERGRRRLEHDGRALSFEVSPNIPPERRGIAAQLHRARQAQLRSHGRARTSPFEDALSESVLWSLLDHAQSRNRLRAYWLLLDGRPRAFIFGLRHARTLYYFLTAIDPAADRYHPGDLLLAWLIGQESESGETELIDLMAGTNLTKELFAAAGDRLRHFDLTAPNPKRLVSRARYEWIRLAREVRLRLGSSSAR